MPLLLLLAVASAGAQPEAGADLRAYDAEFRLAAERALAVVAWAEGEHANVRRAYAERMAGRKMVDGRGGPISIEWMDSGPSRARRDATDASLARMRTKLRWLPGDWRTESYFQDFVDSTTDWLGYHPVDQDDPYAAHGDGPPGPPIAPELLADRIPAVREELDEIVVQCIEELWASRLRLTGLSDHEWGEANAVAADVQKRLDDLAWEFRRAYDDAGGRDEIEAIVRDFEARERALIDDPSSRAPFDAMLADLESLRTRCAAKALDWAAFVEANFQQGPQSRRQRDLDRLSRRVEGLLEDHLTRLHPHWLGRDRPALYTDPVMVTPRAEDVPVRGKPVALFTRPEFAPGLADRALALLAEPAPPAGHKRLVAGERRRLPRIHAAVVVRPTLTEDPIERLLEPDAPPYVPDSPGVTLCVFGFDLLDDEGRFLLPDGRECEVLPTSPGAEYARIGSLPLAIARKRLAENHALLPVYNDAAATVVEGMLPADIAAFELMQVLVLNARLAPGLPPGIQTFAIAGAEGLWFLPHATTNGTLEFVRPRPSREVAEADAPEELFVFDRFAVQLETSDPLALDEVPIIVLRNGEPLQLRAPAGPAPLVARKVPGHPRLMRTETVYLAAPGGQAPADPGLLVADAARADILHAALGTMLFPAPPLDQTRVLQTPDQIRSGEGKGMLFSEAVADAARFNGVHLADLNLADEKVVETITNTIVFNWQRHETSFTLADHAAMLLMKRTFLGMADDRLRSLEALYAEPALVRAHIPEMERQFREWDRLRLQSIDAHGLGSGRIFVPPTLLKAVHVPSPDGLTPFGREQFAERRAANQPGYFPLFWAFWGPGREVFGTAEARESFRYLATKEALRLQIEETKAAIEHARDADDDDIEELLGLTGRGFGPVVARVLPRLVYLRSDPAARTMEWLPHEAARAAVLNLSNTLAELDTAAEGAREDTEAILAVLSAFGVGVGANAAGKAILAAASAVSVGVAAGDVYQLNEDRAETRFAINAAAVIGHDRLQFDLREKQLGAMPFVSLGLSIVGFRLDLADAVAAVRLSQAREVARQWMPHVAREGFDALAQAPLKDKSLVYLLIEEAEQAKAAGRALTPDQEAAIKAGEMLDLQIASRPEWVYEPPRLDPRDEATEIDAPSGARDDAAAPADPDDWRVRDETVNLGDDATVIDADAAPIPLPNTDRAVVRARRYMNHAGIPEGMPAPGYRIDLPDGDFALVGEPIGVGAFATTYELLDAAGLPTGKVVKFLRHNWEQTESKWLDLFEVRGPGDPGMHLVQTHAPWDPTPLEEIIDRMAHGERLLHDAEIPYLPMDGLDTPLGRLGRDGETPFVVQEAIRTDGAYAIFSENLLPNEPAIHAALVKLYKRLADADLIWKDGHVGNVYFQRIANASGGEEWVAGILDPDMIIRWDEAAESTFLRREIAKPFSGVPRYGVNSVRIDVDLAYAEEWAADLHRQVASGPHEFMAKMLEHKGWIRYERHSAEEIAATGAPGAFQGGIIPMPIVREHFGDIEQWVTYGD